MSIAGLGVELRARRLSAVALAEDTIGRIERGNPTLHAFVAITRERALAEAERADREIANGVDRGPLHGIPYAVKDLFDVAGTATTAQSHLLIDNVATAEAEAVRRLAQAGAVLVGKLATYEHAIASWPTGDGPFPAARNPHDLERITGGSSSGSAAAVAATLVRFALGTDTGGSVRSPAAYCGVVGLKPTYGAVSCAGVLPLSPSLDHVGILAASVDDAALVLGAIGDKPNTRQHRADLGDGIDGVVFGYARRFFIDDAPAEFVAALDSAAERLSRLGGRVIEVDLPPYDLFEACGRVILHSEAYAHHAPMLRSRAAAYGKLAFESLAAGAVLSASDLVAAQCAQRLLTVAVNDAFGQCDVVLTANVLATARRVDAEAGPSRAWTAMRTFPFNVTGHPALALPMGRGADGMPIGLQLVAPAGGEAALLRAGAKLERSFTSPARHERDVDVRELVP